MAILKARMVAPVIIIAGVVIFSMVAASISASYSVNAVRDLPDSVSPGDFFNVTVTFTAPADKFNSIGLTEETNKTANMTVEGKKEWCTPEADFVKIMDNKIEILWYGPYDANTAFTAVYKVNVPSDVKEGSYAFNGSVEYYIGGEGPYKEIMGGDKEVKVVIEVPSEGVARTPTPTPSPTSSPTPAPTPTTPEETPALTPEVTVTPAPGTTPAPTPPIPTLSPTPSPSPTPTPPSFEVVFAIAALLSVAYLVLRKKGKRKK